MIDTNTLACCRSPDTSARVTVTPLTRGSRSSNRMVSLATSRIASAMRARRCVFISDVHCPLSTVRRPPPNFGGQRTADSGQVLSDLQLVIDELRHGMPPQRLHDVLQ